ncbi:MAG TPA: thioredoxin family protein [Syntrophomonadaceae bacterium]|nr:thioredoxin family protein [Syntrophomonadaceae bacterium]
MSSRMKLGLALLLILLGIFIGFKLWEHKNSSDVDIMPSENMTATQQIEIAQEAGQPMWLIFTTNSCPYCIDLKEIFDELKVDYDDKIAFIEINLDDKENRELGTKYEIMYVPDNYIYDKDGEISFAQGGLLDKKLLIKELDKVK